MAQFTLRGQGVQAITAGTTALHVNVSSLPPNPGVGLANPIDYYGVAFLRPGDPTGFWEPFSVCGGPQWMPVPNGITQLGYSCIEGSLLTVTEVSGSSPLAFPLASLPDVSLTSPATSDVLSFSSAGTWVNVPASSLPGGGAVAETGQRIVTVRSSGTGVSDVIIYTVPAGHSLIVKSVLWMNWGSLFGPCLLRLEAPTPSALQFAEVTTSASQSDGLWSGWVALNAGDAIQAHFCGPTVDVMVTGTFTTPVTGV